jgi:hypothetical protein
LIAIALRKEFGEKVPTSRCAAASRAWFEWNRFAEHSGAQAESLEGLRIRLEVERAPVAAAQEPYAVTIEFNDQVTHGR